MLYPMRLISNERGCEIHFTYFASDGVEGDALDSIVEWIGSISKCSRACSRQISGANRE